MKFTLSIAALAMLGACHSTGPGPTQPAAPASTATFSDQLREIEAKSGGRLGVALHDGDGHLVGGYRTDERFAMCSTFKYALAAMVLADSASGKLGLDDPLSFRRADLVEYSPGVEPRLAGESGTIPVADAARAAVALSDNTAANLLLGRIGGPHGFTARIRAWGDGVTRLDRTEPDLNENKQGDERDTTSPSAMSTTLWRLAFGNVLPDAQREQLREWGRQTETGRARIRGGLPSGWMAGDKTGSCGSAYNDIAWFETESRGRYTLAVYLDRPTVRGDDANAVIARVAKIAVETITPR